MRRLYLVAALLPGLYSIITGYFAVFELVDDIRTGFRYFENSDAIVFAFFFVIPAAVAAYFSFRSFQAITMKKMAPANPIDRSIAIITIVIFAIVWAWSVLLVLQYPG